MDLKMGILALAKGLATMVSSYFYVIVLATIVLHLCSATRVGHLEEFGNQGTPTKHIEITTDVLQPQKFHEKYVVPKRAAVFRGIARHSAAYWLWKKEYLTEKYGNLITRVESRFEGNSKIPKSEYGLGRDSIGSILSDFDDDKYIISQVPEPLERYLAIPPCLQCGYFKTGLQEVHLFITNKGGKTLLHRDPYSNIHCVFNGTKDWILVEEHQTENVYQNQESRYEFGGFSDIDVDRVDLDKFPKISQLKFGKVTLNRGDCIYMPAGYWHQVRVNGEYNTAMSIWFTRNFKFIDHDWSDCPGMLDEPLDFKPMNEVDFLWQFSGENVDMKQGHMDVHVFRAVLLSLEDSNGRIDMNQYFEKFLQKDENMEQKKIMFMSHVKHEGGRFIKGNSLRIMPIHLLKKLLEVIDPIDPSNKVGFEYSEISRDSIMDEIIYLVQNQNFNQQEFIARYDALGGTERTAIQIYKGFAGEAMDPSTLSLSQIQVISSQVLRNFTEASSHDPTLERNWYRYLKERDEL